ncbi:peptidylprolyl isomerase [Verrucomicrobia bacterium IMCC26134]|nr:peptidylprolyl isomerase [Verrucomicrobia bacterium IMCC26134]
MSRNVVTFHYTLRDTAGQVLDASIGGEPISFLEGSGQIVEGLEEGMRGLAAGVKAKVGVPAAKAYGERDETQVQRVLKSLLPVEGEIKPGDQFRAGEDAFAPIVTVRGVEGDELLLDANHPLAGLDLEFEIEVLAVRAATNEECEHGHAHGGGGCGNHDCGCKS